MTENTPGANSLPTKTPDSLSRTFLVQFAGTSAAALAGILISAGTINSILKYIVPERLPKGAIILVREDNCGDSDWKPIVRGQGHFIVISDNGEFKADHDEAGAPKEIDIDKDHLPGFTGKLTFNDRNFPPLTGGDTGVRFIDKLDSAVEITPNGKGGPLLVRPPWIALTACERK